MRLFQFQFGDRVPVRCAGTGREKRGAGFWAPRVFFFRHSVVVPVFCSVPFC